MGNKLTIEEMQGIALEKNGRCLSRKYINAHQKLKWECEKGHQWEAKPNSIKNGSWCANCAGNKKLTIEEMQEIANKRGGKCLSTEYINGQTKLKWECEKGHQWEAMPNDIKNGNWCADCSHRRLLTIEEMQEIANERGGKCLSTEYINAHTKLKWECEKGHQWEAKPNDIKNNGTWCLQCNIYLNEEICRITFQQLFNNKFLRVRPKWLANSRGNRMELDGYCRTLNIAFEYNGKQHYDKNIFFSKGKNYLKNRKEDDLKKIKLCKEKNIFLFIFNYKDDLSKIVDLIKVQSKLLKLNTSNINFNKKIDYSSIYNENTSFNELKKIVKKKKGKLLSSIYLGSRIKYKIQCQKGHNWEANLSDVKRGSWCPNCSLKERKKKYTIEKMQRLAEERKGECLSNKYINFITKLKWKCKKGHTWEAMPKAILRGTWCADCGGNKKLTIEEMQKIAKAKKGKCLSKKYINSSTKLKWECEFGHQWKTIPRNIKYGLNWCPKCSRNPN